MQDGGGKDVTLTMGCYGMGVTRLVGAIVEQCHDAAGIVWPAAVAPFDVHIVALDYSRDAAVREAADAFLNTCDELGVEALLDDRPLRAGVKFAEADLIGAPHRVTVGARNLKRGLIEHKRRSAAESDLAAPERIAERIAQAIRV